MAISSMTGFARASGEAHGRHWVWDVKSVNGKSLDVRLRLPTGLDHLEIPSRLTLSELFKRGSLQASLTLNKIENVQRLRINEVALEELVGLAEQLRTRLGAQSIQPEVLLGLQGVVVPASEVLDEKTQNEIDSAILDTLTAAAKDLLKSRRDEGARLRIVLEAQLARLQQLSGDAALLPSRKPEAIRIKLYEQVNKLLDASSSFEPDRLHQEAALLATRYDIQEELDRLGAHLEAARALLRSPEPIGRKFDFLAQEFNREANTLCSKSNDVALTAIGIEIKTVIDQMREQVQNIE
jgi:uncharacterized protein (TIGR00255 family)